jgi:inorganic triphosphatase YgiF
MSSAPTETEIKLLLKPGQIGAVERHPAFAKSKPITRHERTTYFDTDDLGLRERGYSLRVRKCGSRHVQTLKHADFAAAVVGQRNEWEWPVTSNQVDPAPLDALASRAGELGGEYAHARPRFVTDIKRKSYLLDLGGGTKVEAVIDQGSVRAGSACEDVSELEIEVKDGPLGPAYRLALDLARGNVLRLGTESKADRGYRLISGRTAGPEKSYAAMLTKHASLQDAIAPACGTALAQFTANITAAEAGDVEGIHQMRIALRRLRTAFVLFAPHLERDQKERFNDEIRKLGMPLGFARDWDVFVMETLPNAVEDGVPEALLSDIAVAGRKQRERSHAAVKRLLRGTRPTKLVLEIETWTTAGEWRDPDSCAASTLVAGLLPGLLDRILHKVKKRAGGIGKLSRSELHPLRKSVKKLRYSSEDASALFKKSHVESYLRHCRKLQTLMGQINDTATTARLIAVIGGRTKGARALLKWNDGRYADARESLHAAWRKLDRAKPFWR